MMETAGIEQPLDRGMGRLECSYAAGDRCELTDNFTGDELADHICTPGSSHKADNPPPLAAPHR